MLRKLAIALGVIAIGTGVGVLVKLHAQNARFTSFTAVVQTTMRDAEGHSKAWKIDTETFLSDGSQIHVANSYNGKPVGWKTVLDVAGRKRLTVDPDTNSVTTYPLTEKAAVQESEHKSCPGEAAGSILGYRVVKGSLSSIGKRDPNAPFQERDVSLVAPDLDCFALDIQRSLVNMATQEVTSKQSVRALSILKSEVSRDELRAPAGYVERAPSEVHKMRAALAGRTCTQCELKSKPVLDEVYLSYQANGK